MHAPRRLTKQAVLVVAVVAVEDLVEVEEVMTALEVQEMKPRDELQ